MSVKQISATARTKVGKGAARAVRREGKVPAVIYGAGAAPVAIALNAKEMNQLVYGGHFLTNVLEIDVGGKKSRVIPRDYALDPVKDTVEHIDFLRVDASSRIRVEVPVHAINAATAPGVKLGGSVNIVAHTIALLAPADAIPDSIDVDVSALNINDSLHISQVTLPANVSFAGQGDETLISIVPPVAEEEAPADEAAEGDAAAKK